MSFNLLNLEGSLREIIYFSCGIYSAQWFFFWWVEETYIFFLMVIKILDLLYIDFVFFRKTFFFFLCLFLKSSFCSNLFGQLYGFQKYNVHRKLNVFYFGGLYDFILLWCFHWPFQFKAVFFFLYIYLIYPNHLILPQNIKLIWIYFVSSLII